uniref:Uncharacterized protein n=1 Tax=Nelumbo nucifera TaxID=4432 RepID=A0A822Y2W3_NELNU|nr:TPA_asm: hypothetical protein HUJ06_027781 [Nelumbo nucifera]
MTGVGTRGYECNKEKAWNNKHNFCTHLKIPWSELCLDYTNGVAKTKFINSGHAIIEPTTNIQQKRWVEKKEMKEDEHNENGLDDKEEDVGNEEVGEGDDEEEDDMEEDWTKQLQMKK